MIVRENTLVIAKPCSMSSQLVGRIFSAFEVHGLQIVSIRNKRMTVEDLERMYPHIMGMPFWFDMCYLYTREDAVIANMTGLNAVQVGRAVTLELRGLYGNLSIRHDNKVHASDSLEAYEKECKIFF